MAMQITGEVTKIEKANGGAYTVHILLDLGTQKISLENATSETDPSEAVAMTARWLRALGGALAKAFEYDVNLK